jgi:hypothetical protein
MARFGTKSQEKLATMDKRIVEIAKAVVQEMNISATYGMRGEAEQNELFNTGYSKLEYPKSAHNNIPSLAGDFQPYPVNWNNLAEFTQMRELFYYHAGRLGYQLKPMIIFSDGTGDYPHIEIKT